MSTKEKVWNDPQPHQKVVWKPVTRKSRAGVEYTRTVPVLEGTAPTGLNRLGRRKQAAFERSALYRKAIERENRKKAKKAEAAHKTVVETAKKKVKK